MILGQRLGRMPGTGVVLGIHVREAMFGVGPVVTAGVPLGRVPGEREPHDFRLARIQREVDRGRRTGLAGIRGRQLVCDSRPRLPVRVQTAAQTGLVAADRADCIRNQRR